MASEAALQGRLVKKFRTMPGVRVLNISGGPYQEPRISDLILNWRGLFVAIELKAPGRFGGAIVLPADFKPTSKREIGQKAFQLEIVETGGVAFFSDDFDMTINYLTEIML